MGTFKYFTKCPLLGAVLALQILGGHLAQAQPDVEEWARRYNGLATVVVSEVANEKIVVDAAGNVIVAGFTSFPSGYDGLITKYSGAGVPLWTNRYGTTGNAYHLAIAVATDGSGNVLVAGDLNLSNGTVLATFKYSSAGLPLWTNLGPFGSASALASDGNGNVFVTGTLFCSNGWSDFATIGYSSTGVPMWTNRLNEGNGGYATGLAVDNNGNVFVTGISYGTNGLDSFATTKYSGAGLPLWTNHGPGGSARAVATDGNGNVYVTGWSYRSDGSDYATIKYSGTGVPLWTNHYNEPGNRDATGIALAVDSGGSVFVTGNLFGTNSANWNYATVGYSSAGVPLWTNRFNSGYDPYDRAAAVAVDGSGNVVVAGWPAMIKYSGTGLPLWTNFGGANAIAVDSSANVFVTGNGATTTGYSGAGMPLWTNQHLESAIIGGDDKAVAVGVDGTGNVVVTGWSVGTNGSADCATIKYSDAGVPLWTNRYSGGEATALAVDSSGNVVVTGRSPGTNGYSDYETIKYSGAGVSLWTNRYNGPGNYFDEATAVVVDDNGNVVVTGGSSDNNSGYSYVTIKYTGEGLALWTNRGPSGGGAARALAVDGGGNIFVAGSWFGGSSYDYATIKYSGAGVPSWTNRYAGSGNDNDIAKAIVVDNSGNVVVTGTSGSDIATIKYSGAGVALWTNRHNGPGNYSHFAPALAMDSGGNVVVTGSSYSTNGFDYFTIKYSGAGLPVWTNRYKGPGPTDDAIAVALGVDSSGNVVVMGNSFDANGNFGLATIKYSGAGVALWTNRFYRGEATALVVDGSGNVVVTGSYYNNDGSSDFLTIKYSPAGLPLLTIARTITNTVAVSWPSPSTGFTLQQNTDPSTTNWSPVGTTPLDDGVNRTVVVNPPVGNRFYRLVHP